MRKPKQPVRLFYSYARQDESLQKELEKHLTILRRQEFITTWHNREIVAGTEKLRQIDAHLNEAHIILLLISVDFLASDYCYGYEMQFAMQRHETEQARVIPVILRPADWTHTLFSKLQVLPKDGKPITSWSRRHDREKAFLEVSLSIRDIITATSDYWAKDFYFKPLEPGTEPPLYNEKAVNLDMQIAFVQETRANTLFDSHRYEEALAIYEQAITLYPSDANFYNGKANALEALHKYTEALSVYNQAIQLNPENAMLYHSKGNILEKLVYYEESLITYSQAIHRDPVDAIFYNSRGNLLKHLHRYEEALADYSQAIGLDPKDIASRRSQGDILYKLNRLQEALLVYEELFAWNNVKDRHLIQLYIGRILVHLQRDEQAILAYEQVLYLKPDNIEAHHQKCELLTRLGLHEDLLTNEKYKIDSQIAAHCNKGALFYMLGRYAATWAETIDQYQNALTEYDQAIILDPSNSIIVQNKIALLLRSSSAYDAIALYEQAGLFATRNILTDPQITLSLLEHVLQKTPDSLVALHGKADALSQLQRYDEALVAYKQAQYCAGYVQDSTSSQRISEKVFSRISRAPTVEAALVPHFLPRRVEVYNRGFYIVKILLVSKQVPVTDPDRKHLREMRRYIDQLIHAEKSLQQNSKDIKSNMEKADALFEMLFYEKALIFYDRALSLAHTNKIIGRLLLKKGHTLLLLQRYEDASRTYHQAISITGLLF